jgi:Tfp pilus assembly protein PilZ
MENFGSENRKYERRSIQRPILLLDTGSHNLPSHILMDNLSGGGVLIHTSADVPLGDEVKMMVELPFPQKWFGAKRVQVIVKGKVIRRDGPGKLAIQFNNPELIGRSLDN